MVHVTVDMSLPENQNPKPQLEDDEFIENFTVKLGGLYAECERFEKEGYVIDARVAGLAEGVELAKKWKL
jgi:ADP-ribose pyrophosphatase